MRDVKNARRSMSSFYFKVSFVRMSRCSSALPPQLKQAILKRFVLITRQYCGQRYHSLYYHWAIITILHSPTGIFGGWRKESQDAL